MEQPSRKFGKKIPSSFLFKNKIKSNSLSFENEVTFFNALAIKKTYSQKHRLMVTTYNDYSI